MANGPMGGFMPTPPAPAQPPQVKLDSTASSRGTFSNFLKNMNGATSLNPPSMAPSVGATTPTLAPASNIDIFNEPVAMMQFGGDPMDASFSDFAGFSDSSDPFGGGDTSIDDVGSEEDPTPSTGLTSEMIQAGTRDVPLNVFADDAQASVGTNVGLEKSGGFTAGVQKDVPGRFTAFRSPSFAMRGIARDFRSKINNAGDDGLTVSNYFNTFNPSDDNKDRLAEFESLTGKKAGDKLNINDMQNIMNIQAKYEAGIRDVPGSVQNAILSTVDIDDDRKVEDILGSLDLGPLDKKSPTDGIDPFEIGTNQVFTPAMAGLPTVSSRFNQTKPKSDLEQLRDAVALTIQQTTRPQSNAEKGLQQNQAIQQGFNLGPLTFDDDLANFRANERSRGFDEISRVGDDFDTALDMADREKVVFDEDDDTFEDRFGVRAKVPDAAKIFGGKQITNLPIGTTTRSTAPEDFEENVGLPFSDRRMRDIERLYNVPEGQRRTGEGDDPNILSGIPSVLNIFERIPREQMAIDVALGRPRGLGEMIRGFTATPARNMAEFTNRLQRNIIGPEGDTTGFTSKTIPESQLIRNNRGRITAITDASGRTITGVNPDEQIGGDDNQSPIIRRPIGAKEEEKDEDTPPNIIGGGTPPPVLDTVPTVVASPFAKSDATFSPVTFDAGDLNKLIEALTGVAARPAVAAQDGGLSRAVDDFIATAR